MVTDRDKMIENNIGLVHSIANRFKGRGVDYDDLFQSGCVGLIKAVDNFDESRGFAFSTYAVPVIMGEIKRIFRDGGAVKVSRSLKEKAIKAQSLRENLLMIKCESRLSQNCLIFLIVRLRKYLKFWVLLLLWYHLALQAMTVNIL